MKFDLEAVLVLKMMEMHPSGVQKTLQLLVDLALD